MPTRPDRSRGRKRLNRRLDGERFGRLVVVRFGGQHRTAGLNPRWLRVWLCRCDCGNEVSIREDHLLHNKTRSCGCLRKPEIISLEQREAETALAMPFRSLLAKTMEEGAIPYKLLRLRWLGEPSSIAASMGVQRRKLRPFDEIMHRTAPRVPEDDETRFLAECLNIRGIDKERFLKAARDAREAIKAYRYPPRRRRKKNRT